MGVSVHKVNERGGIEYRARLDDKWIGFGKTARDAAIIYAQARARKQAPLPRGRSRASIAMASITSIASIATDDVMATLSAYELARKRNMAQNQARLGELGLS